MNRRNFLDIGVKSGLLIALPKDITSSFSLAEGHNTLPLDYEERVYAGVLGKIIGLFLGLPNEGLGYDDIIKRMGGINHYYPHGRFNGYRDKILLISTSDDLTGHFTFIRSLQDNDYPTNITPKQIGDTWLNYLVENRTSLWWGGMGESTEHTAYLRLKNGIPAPASGSIRENGRLIAEQIGGRIFVDSWAMVAPGDPAQAAEYAYKASSVSHDGEGVWGGVLIAAMEAAAFLENDLNILIQTGLKYIPKDSLTYRVTQEIVNFHKQEKDWQVARGWIAENYPYKKYGGVCPMVPNNAIVIMALLYGNNDFNRSMMIVNTSGWDVDCNTCAVGCLLGIKNGLRAFDGPLDWRGPVADRLYVVSADAGRMITDAVQESFHLINTGLILAGKPPRYPKNGARFHFDLPGAVQGFHGEENLADLGLIKIFNTKGKSEKGSYVLALACQTDAGKPARAATYTFMPPETLEGTEVIGGKDTFKTVYNLAGSPTLYSGQQIEAALKVSGDGKGLKVKLYIRHYNEEDGFVRVYGPELLLTQSFQTYYWNIPETGGYPIFEIGVECFSVRPLQSVVYLDYLTWHGTAQTTLSAPSNNKGSMLRRAWLNAATKFSLLSWSPAFPFFIVQEKGIGLVIQGTRDWRNYSAATILKSNLATQMGIAARVQGLRRFYALVITKTQKVQLIKHYDDQVIVLHEKEYHWDNLNPYTFKLEVKENTLTGWINNQLELKATDDTKVLSGGAFAFLCEEGCVAGSAVTIQNV